MAFVVREFEASAGGRTGTGYELTDEAGTVRAEVWPQWGFNCLRWQVRQQDGRWADILYTAPDWETNPIPTRSGHPILFPFPGRLRDGRLTHEGKTYQLSLNDSTKSHAIHGFTPRNPWRVIETSGGPDSATITGQFCLSQDLPSALDQWPADFALNVTYRLHADRLRVECVVENRGPGTLPFGIGYHPYFRLPGVHDADIGGHILTARAAELWEAEENLPTGRRLPVPPELDFRTPRPIGDTALDHVFTSVKFLPLAELSHPSSPGALRFFVAMWFRELVLFTPPHRQAIAVEPYTCSADASNLAAQGIDTGWQVIGEGERWGAHLEYAWQPHEL